MSYSPNPLRYNKMTYNRCGNSGLKLPALSLGLWQNFGYVDALENCRNILKLAFDSGITHFDLANNYGPPPGSAEENFGKILKTDFDGLRDEMIISTKAGYTMWDGPYGDWGSKKYLISSLDQSLKRMNLEYVDIFYHHRPDPETPLEETMHALSLIVQQGKALYVGISNYLPTESLEAIKILHELGTPCIIHQPKYSMFERWIEAELLDLLKNKGVGCIPFSPLAQGLLTDKYIDGIPSDSRAAKGGSLLQRDITPERLSQIKLLNNLAKKRGQTLAQMAIAWILKHKGITSVLIGARTVDQLKGSLHALDNLAFSPEELKVIRDILG